MKWKQVSVLTTSEAVEAVSNILMDSGANGVEIEDANDVSRYEVDQSGVVIDRDAIDHIKEGAKVTAYYPETIFLPEIMPTIKERVNALKGFGLDIGENQIDTKEVIEDNWASAWKKYYHPVSISRYLTIVPEWEDYQADTAEEKIIKMDPGMAFGTGSHPTTRLSLQALELVLRGGETVIDVGTGSGILSIASMLLGAKDVYAYDVDEVAIKVAKENIALNPSASEITIATNDLLKGIDQQADIIVANILADIIIKLIPDAFNLLKDDGTFIISGIIEDKEAEVLNVLNDNGFVVDIRLQQKDWLAFIIKKGSDL